MPRSVVRSLVGPDFITLPKSQFEASPTDRYRDKQLKLFYNSQDRLNFVEAFEPSEITFRQFRLIGRSLGEVAAELAPLGVEFVETDFSEARHAPTHGFGVYFRGQPEEACVICGVYVHPEGYYDKAT